MINVVIASPFCEEYKRLIMQAGGETCCFTELSEDMPEAEQEDIIAGAEVLIGFGQERLLAHAKKLKLIQLTWAGVDSVVDKVPEGVVLANASGAFGPIISEYAFACVMALCRRLPSYTRQKTWKRLGSEITLENKRALILGAGDLGSCTAKRFKAFDVETVGIRRRSGEKPECFDEMYTMEALDEQLALADFVVCCLPGTKDTKRVLDERRLRLMKKDAILVNVGRGSLIDNEALAKVMAEGHLFGAALDVTDPEPLPDGHPLWKLDNVIITPHVSGIGFGHLKETEKRIADICAENLRRYVQGEALMNVVDLKAGY